MSDNNEMDYEKAMRELIDAENELRKMAGEPEKQYIKAEPPFCSFCGKGKNEVKAMLTGPSVYICNECVLKCQKILENLDK